MQFIEEIFGFFGGGDAGVTSYGSSWLRILRVLRLVRIFRLVRILYLLRELRTMLSSIICTCRSFFWTMVLLLIVNYAFGVYVTQIVADHARTDPNDVLPGSPIRKYYGSMGGSVLTLYSTISGGLDWRNAADPLAQGIGPSMTVAFCIFIAFTTFSLLNIVTGVFVEAALQNTKEEADLNMVDRLWEVFNIEKLPANGRISYFDFVNHLENVQMKSYFKSVDLDISEAKNLFRLLDVDDSGSIQAEDFVMGCLRLRGSAKAIDLATLMLETRRYHRKTQTQIAKLHDLCQRMVHDAGTRGTALVSLAQ